MPLLGARMARFFRPESLAENLAGLHPVECWSLGRCYDALDWAEAGIAAYRAALDRASGNPELTQVLRELGHLYKRLGRRDEAAEVWEAWIGTDSRRRPDPVHRAGKASRVAHARSGCRARLGRLGLAHRRGLAARDRARRRRWLICVTDWKGWSASWRATMWQNILKAEGHGAAT